MFRFFRIPSANASTASPFSRACLLAYSVLIFYASGYPFSGWQFESAAAYLAQIQDWPHYWTAFDAIVNILGYIPFGVLLALSLFPHVRNFAAVFLASSIGFLTSFAMESMQFFIPSRVTSLLDFVTNGLGCAVGAVIGVVLLPHLLNNERLRYLKHHHLQDDTPRELLLVGLWPLAQIAPHAFLFGLGQILPKLTEWAQEYLEIEIDMSALLHLQLNLNAEEFLVSETLVTACATAGSLLIWNAMLSKQAPKLVLNASLLLASLGVCSLANALMFGTDYAFFWMAPGARGGLIIGLIMLYGFSFAPTRAQRRLALLLLSLSLLAVNLIPSNPYFLNTMQSMVPGKMLNFYGAAQFLSLVWPFAAIWMLLQKRSPKSTPNKEIQEIENGL